MILFLIFVVKLKHRKVGKKVMATQNTNVFPFYSMFGDNNYNGAGIAVGNAVTTILNSDSLPTGDNIKVVVNITHKPFEDTDRAYAIVVDYSATEKTNIAADMETRVQNFVDGLTIGSGDLIIISGCVIIED